MLMTDTEIHETFQISERTVRRWRSDGRLPQAGTYTPAGGTTVSLFAVEDVKALVRKARSID
ncbi:hypothetical protein AXA44_40575 [Rhodococcus sp. SC4]|nr:hypothetical protein AXA44_40575 [Rhodococcus sp. SC4]